MSSASRILFVGIGSPHGDDQVGWRIADALQPLVSDQSEISIRKATVPLDLVDWLDGIVRLHICDAWLSAGPIGSVRRLDASCSGSARTFEFSEPDRARGALTHGIGLAAVLDLATRLGRMPRHVVVHAVAARRFEPGDSMSKDLTNRIPEITRTIWDEIASCGK